MGKIRSWIKIAAESVKQELACNMAKVARGYRCPRGGRAGGREEERKYTEDINLPRLIETRKTCEALQR